MRLVRIDRTQVLKLGAGFIEQYHLHVYEGRQRLATFDFVPGTDTAKADVEWARTAEHKPQ